MSEIPASSTRDELRAFAKGEFERHRDVTDIVGATVAYLVIKNTANARLGTYSLFDICK